MSRSREARKKRAEKLCATVMGIVHDLHDKNMHREANIIKRLIDLQLTASKFIDSLLAQNAHLKDRLSDMEDAKDAESVKSAENEKPIRHAPLQMYERVTSLPDFITNHYSKDR